MISSAPAAIFCNLARLCITVQLFAMGFGKLAETFFHDVAGLAMMPLAVSILAAELAMMMKKLVVPHPQAPAPSQRSAPRAAVGEKV